MAEQDLVINKGEYPQSAPIQETEKINSRFVVFTASSALFPPDSDEMLNVNASLSTITAYGIWTKKALLHSSDVPIDGFDTIMKINYSERNLSKASPLLATPAIFLPGDVTPENDPKELRARINSMAGLVIGDPKELPDDTEYVNLDISSQEEFEILAFTVDRFRHDYGNELAAVSLTAAMIKRAKSPEQAAELEDRILTTLRRGDAMIENARSEFADEHPKEKLKIKDKIVGALEGWSSDLETHGLILQNEASHELSSRDRRDYNPSWDLEVEWSRTEFDRFRTNVRNDIINAYAARDNLSPARSNVPKVVYTNVHFSDDRERLIIDVEDRATGFLNEAQIIVQTGRFPHKFSYYPDQELTKGASEESNDTEIAISKTGVGLSGLQETIEKHYGGQLIPSNVLDEQGNIIGARISLSLPVVKK